MTPEEKLKMLEDAICKFNECNNDNPFETICNMAILFSIVKGYVIYDPRENTIALTEEGKARGFELQQPLGHA